VSDLPARSDAGPSGVRNDASAARAARLLVVDDNDDNRNLLSRRLRSKGYEVDLAPDGPSALEACAKAPYDAILLDVMMPGMSGLEVLLELRRKHAKTELAVIMATAKNDSASVVDALKQGANDYVTKPIDFPVLLARLETHLAMKAEAAERAGAQVDVTFGIAPGTVLCQRYEILEKRGEGGFAVVYRARQLSTDRDVALKHLRPDVLCAPGDNTQLERFERESKLIGELNHPNVVRLIDSGRLSLRTAGAPSTAGAGPGAGAQAGAGSKAGAQPGADAAAAGGAQAAAVVDCADGAAPAAHESGETRHERADAASQTRRRPPEQDTLAVPYIVMELLTGEPMNELIAREAPLEPARAIDLMLPVLSALAAAHDKGVVHRDVKPSNIMLAKDDRGAIEPKVLDFGIAKLTTREGTDLTVSSSLIGTPQYMSPEQALGRKNLDGRADQFSAAAVLYQALTGRPLYQGDSLLELVGRVLAGDHTPLATARPDLPPALAAVITRALSTEADRRYASMAAFGAALLPFASASAAHRWTDEFGAAAEAARASETAPSVEVVDIVVSGPAAEPAPVLAPRPARESVGAVVAPAQAGGTDPTLQLPGVAKPPPPDAPTVSPTLVSGAPRASETHRAAASSVTSPAASASATPTDASTSTSTPTPTDAPTPIDTPAAPQTSLAPTSAPVPWERVALIILATAAVLYALARYLV
jgi:serine/threonine-protein kinase